MAQLVARLNGIQKARGSNPLVSTKKISYILYDIFLCGIGDSPRFHRGVALQHEPLRADAYGYYGSVQGTLLTNAVGRLLIRFLL